MSNLTAMKSCASFFSFGYERDSHPISSLKRQAFLFDRIGLIEFEFYRSIYSSFEQNFDDLAELEWLRANDIVFDIDILSMVKNEKFMPFLEFLKDNNMLELTEVIKRHRNSVKELLEQDLKKMMQKELNPLALIETMLDIAMSEEDNEMRDKLLQSDHKRRITKIGSEVDKKMWGLDATLTRLLVFWIEFYDRVQVIPLLPYTGFLHDIPNSRKKTVVEIVINQLPIPDDSTPWESILDYRADPDAKNNLLSLRRWIRKISLENLSTVEIEDELSWLINEFRKNIQFHKMKANVQTLEALVKAPLEIVEDLVKLKFSKLPEPFFVIKKRQLSLMEAELNSPGREIAYIVKTNEAFG